MRSQTQVQRDLDQAEFERKELNARWLTLRKEMDEIKRAKQRARPKQDELNAIHKAKFADQVVPGVFVRVIGARSYPWKYVENVDDNSFIGKGVLVRGRARYKPLGYEILHGNVSTTMIGKIREVLTPEQFEERFGAMV